MIKTVQDLIDKLNLIKDKSKGIFIFVPDHDINNITIVDELEDRVDINSEELQ